MGNCNCCNQKDVPPSPWPEPEPDPIDTDPKHTVRIEFVVYEQTGKNKKLKIEDECGFPPAKDFGEYYCCQARFNRKQRMVDFNDVQLPVWFPFLDTKCTIVSSPDKVKYDYSKCEYVAPYIKELKLTIGSKLDVYDDFQYIFRKTQKLKAVEGTYSRGAYYDASGFPVEPKDRKVIDPKTGNTLISELALDPDKKYSPIGVLAYIICTPDIESVEAAIKLNNDGTANVGVGPIYKEYKCIGPYNIPEVDGAGYKEGGKYKLVEPFKADLQRLLDGKDSGYFIYPILIDYEYSGFEAPDDKIKSTTNFSIDTTLTKKFPSSCVGMNSCKASSIAESIYKDLNIADSLTCTANVINGKVFTGCLEGSEECSYGKNIEFSIKKINIPAPDSPKDDVVYRLRVAYGVWDIKNVDFPVVSLPTMAVVGSQNLNNEVILGGIYTHVFFTGSYIKGSSKDVSTKINVEDLCNKIKNQEVNLPCVTIKAKINPSYDPKKYVGSTCPAPFTLYSDVMLVGETPITENDTVGLFYSVGTYNTTNMFGPDAYWYTTDCEGNLFSCFGSIAPVEAFPKRREWALNSKYIITVKLNYVINISVPNGIFILDRGFFNKTKNTFTSLEDTGAAEYSVNYIVEQIVE